MGFVCSTEGVNSFLRALSRTYRVVAPVRFEGGGAFTGTDCVRYAEITDIDDVVFDEKSRFSFKELLLPPSQTLFYFTEDHVTEPSPAAKPAVIFLRSCDLHAVRRLDEIYRGGGNPDYYYEQRRKDVRFVLMGCTKCFDSCFCVDMGTNVSENYDLSIESDGAGWRLDCKDADWAELLRKQGGTEAEVTPSHVTETKTRVRIPENLDFSVAKCGTSMTNAASPAGAATSPAPPAPAFPCRISSIRITRRPASAGECKRPAWWTDLQIWRAVPLTGRTTALGCATRCCTRSTISTSAVDSRCAWAAGDATTFVPNTSRSPVS